MNSNETNNFQDLGQKIKQVEKETLDEFKKLNIDREKPQKLVIATGKVKTSSQGGLVEMTAGLDETKLIFPKNQTSLGNNGVSSEDTSASKDSKILLEESGIIGNK